MKIIPTIFIIGLSFGLKFLHAETNGSIEQFPELKLDPKKNQKALDPSILIKKTLIYLNCKMKILLKIRKLMTVLFTT